MYFNNPADWHDLINIKNLIWPDAGISDLSSPDGRQIGSRIPGIKVMSLANFAIAISLLPPWKEKLLVVIKINSKN